MDNRITVVTLGVRDLAASRRFYCDGLGFRAAAGSDENIVFLAMGGVVLALFPRDRLAEDANVGKASRGERGFGGVTLAQNVKSPAEVDAAVASAVAAGARLLKAPQKVFWGGYSGYFADPDGHPWEIAHNPFWELSEDGRVLLPD